MIKHGLDTDYPATKFQEQIRILETGKSVKYGEGDDSYAGFKHKAVVLTGEEFPPTVVIHNRDQLDSGIYDLVIELVAEGKIKTRNHYVFNETSTSKLKTS